MSDIDNLIGRDPLYVEYAKVANGENLNSKNISSGDIAKKIGRYTMVSHYMVDCMMYALEDTPKTCWKIVIYLLRNISGKSFDKIGKPKTFIRYNSVRKFLEKTNIKSTDQFYKAKKTLEDRRIIYFKEDRLYLNLFPLTWKLENNFVREKIKGIIEEEIEKIKSKRTKKKGA